MGLNKHQQQQIVKTLVLSLRTKFANHNPEPASMPFYTKLLGKDRLALYQFIHSLNTNFGTTIFEPFLLSLITPIFDMAASQRIGKQQISTETNRVIHIIINHKGLNHAIIK